MVLRCTRSYLYPIFCAIFGYAVGFGDVRAVPCFKCRWQLLLDRFLIVFGVVGAVLGVSDSLRRLIEAMLS